MNYRNSNHPILSFFHRSFSVFLQTILIWCLSSQDLSYGKQLLSEERYEKAVKYYWHEAAKGDAEALSGYAQSIDSVLILQYKLPQSFHGKVMYPYHFLAANAGHSVGIKNVAFYEKRLSANVIKKAKLIAKIFHPLPIQNFESSPPPVWK
jgi:hypothetical protein